MNEVTEITVQYVNLPKEGKKFGSIKSSEGDYFGALPTMLRQFSVGEVCKIEFKTNEAGYKNLVKKIGGAPKQTGPIPIPQIRARANPVDSEQIFTTALLKEYIAAGKLDLETVAIAEAVKTIRDAYRFTFGGSERQRNETDIQDEIPH